MTLTRQDAWTQDEDLLLAETVLRHIRDGGTQLKAFEEVGKRLSRTAAACGFRWNSFVRKQFQSGIELAKKHRKELKKTDKKQEKSETSRQETSIKEETAVRELSLQEVKSYLDGLYERAENIGGEKKAIEQYEFRIKDLERQIYYLSAENEKLENELNTIERDHRAMVEIMERAMKMVGQKDEAKERELQLQTAASSPNEK
ncbi:RsfA family transcriptional regulator [Mesobacillus zeae]|uniref:RsfA family transcriptional regulator n=1 Tax=Mesobacillus zeae TaxID=1917180 RepID=A0A398BE30_9BACI|nr:RsfA family transcriptional regulator [Mesobacillus zeae]RID87894.1 RsfA family transcriptional regulator [Mesobacillus zeae]